MTVRFSLGSGRFIYFLDVSNVYPRWSVFLTKLERVTYIILQDPSANDKITSYLPYLPFILGGGSLRKIRSQETKEKESDLLFESSS